MNLTINYTITDFTEQDADNIHQIREQVYDEIARLHMTMIEEVYARRRDLMRTRNSDQIAEAQRWARFLHFCHTGVML